MGFGDTNLVKIKSADDLKRIRGDVQTKGLSGLLGTFCVSRADTNEATCAFCQATIHLFR